MRAWLVALTLGLLVGVANAAPRQEDGPDDIHEVARNARRIALIERIERRYQSYKTVKGRFVQVVHLRDQDATRVRKGRLLFRRPGKLRFSFDDGDWVASDGTWVRAYDKAEKILYKMKAKRSLYPPALAFLEGEDGLKASFSWRLLEVEGREGVVAMVGRPKVATPAMTQLVLLVDEHIGRIRRVMVVDAEGNTNRFTFEAMQSGVRIPHRTFRPKKPRGARVVHP